MKLIKSPQDLAINGAMPAFEEPLHVGRPNMGSRENFIKYVDDIFDRKWLTNNGLIVREFEQKVAAHHGVKHCVGMCSGTIALEIAIRALKLEGEVIIPSFTFIATAHALHWQGITPVFADIDSVTHTLDPDSVRSMVTSRTTGIIGVHLWGRPASVNALQEIADEHGLKLMFDAAHAFGCSDSGTMIGSFGECEILSFHATKFFNTFEGGAVLTNNDELAETMRLMRNFGFSGMDNVIHPGTNGKMIEVAAAMGMVNLEAIDNVIEINQRNYEAYLDGLNDLFGINILAFNKTERNNYQYVVMEVGEESPVTRDELIDALHAENILARKYFWPGCHNMKPYKELFPNAGLVLKNTKRVADRVLILPTGTAMEPDMVQTVIAVIQVIVASYLSKPFR